MGILGTVGKYALKGAGLGAGLAGVREVGSLASSLISQTFKMDKKGHHSNDATRQLGSSDPIDQMSSDDSPTDDDLPAPPKAPELNRPLIRKTFRVDTNASTEIQISAISSEINSINASLVKLSENQIKDRAERYEHEKMVYEKQLKYHDKLVEDYRENELKSRHGHVRGGSGFGAGMFNDLDERKSKFIQEMMIPIALMSAGLIKQLQDIAGGEGKGSGVEAGSTFSTSWEGIEGALNAKMITGDLSRVKKIKTLTTASETAAKLAEKKAATKAEEAALKNVAKGSAERAVQIAGQKNLIQQSREALLDRSLTKAGAESAKAAGVTAGHAARDKVEAKFEKKLAKAGHLPFGKAQIAKYLEESGLFKKIGGKAMTRIIPGIGTLWAFGAGIADLFYFKDMHSAVANFTQGIISALGLVAAPWTGASSEVAAIMAIIALELYKIQREIVMDVTGMTPDELTAMPGNEYTTLRNEILKTALEAFYDWVVEEVRLFNGGKRTTTQLQNDVNEQSTKIAALDAQLATVAKSNPRAAAVMSQQRNQISKSLAADKVELEESRVRAPDTMVASGKPTANDNHHEMTTITYAGGKKATVGAEYAPAFQGLINFLESKNYPIKSVGGFNERNISGSGTKSWHSHGAAIDINPKENDLGTGTGDILKYVDKAELDAKLAELGLGWGAEWKTKNDPMHFSAAANEGGKWGINRQTGDVRSRPGETAPSKAMVLETPPTPVIGKVSSASPITTPRTPRAVPPLMPQPTKSAPSNMAAQLSPFANRSDLDVGITFRT